MTMTEAELRQLPVIARDLAKRAMRQSHCRWIDVAIEEGWSKSLEDLFFSAAREGMRAPPFQPPPLSWFDDFPVRPTDHTYLKNHGIAHLKPELDRIIADRKQARQRSARGLFGEAAE